jgi:hypothetical protein
LGGYELNVYAVPAAISIVLLIVETLFLAVALPETRQISKPVQAIPKTEDAKVTNGQATVAPALPAEVKIAKLAQLRQVHFWFLALFSVRGF